MATDINKMEGLENMGVDPFDAPIPGESLTSDPESPKKWEQAPQFSTEKDAIQHVFLALTEEGNYEQVVDIMRDGVPIDMIAQTYLFKGFQEGAWSTDLMLLLVEPTIYILMWLADEMGVDAVLDSDGDDWEDEVESKMRSDMKEDLNIMSPPPQVPQSILAQMDSFKEKVGAQE